MRPTLLVVEDDDAMRTVWQVVFAGRGWRVVSAATVAEGLAGLDPAPDCLILDLDLPDGDGEAILRRVRDAGLKTRVVVTTGSATSGTLEALRPEALLTKPFNVADVWREGLVAI